MIVLMGYLQLEPGDVRAFSAAVQAVAASTRAEPGCLFYGMAWEDADAGRMLVAQHNLPVNVKDGAGVKTLPAGLSVFRIVADGKLDFARKYDIDTGDKVMFWMGMVPL